MDLKWKPDARGGWIARLSVDGSDVFRAVLDKDTLFDPPRIRWSVVFRSEIDGGHAKTLKEAKVAAGACVSRVVQALASQ